jgi:hypothetical protein
MLPFLLVSLLVRLMGFNTPAIWYDESVTKYRASLPWMQYMRDNADYTGINLWEILLRPFAHGPVWLLRLPALACAMLSLWIAWKVMQRLGFTRPQMITAAIGMALLPGLIWQAQDARFYAAMSACYLAAIWYALNNRPLGLLACAGLLAYIHPVGAAYGATVLIIALITGMPFKRLLLAATGAALAWLPYYTKFVLFNNQGEFWLHDIMPSYAIIQTLQALFVNTMPVFTDLLALFMLIGILSIAALKTRTQNGRILFAAVMAPAIIMLIEGQVFEPVYFYRPAQPLCIPFCLMVGSVISPSQRRVTWIAPALASLVLLAGLMNYNPANRGGGLDKTTHTIADYWQDGDLIVYVSPMTAFPYDYYLPEYPNCLLGFDEVNTNLGPPLTRGYDMCQLDKLPDHTGRLWLVWNKDPLIPDDVTARLERLTTGLTPIDRTDAWQFATIEIYLIEEK